MSTRTHATNWVSIAQAAAHFGVHRDTVRRWIRSGSVHAERLGGNVIRVDLDSIAREAAHVAKPSTQSERARSDDLSTYIERLVESAPPLTPRQRSLIASIALGASS